MSRTEDFCRRIGLNDSIRRWLAANEGDPFRDEIVFLLNQAIQSDLAETYLQILRSKIAKIAR